MKKLLIGLLILMTTLLCVVACADDSEQTQPDTPNEAPDYGSATVYAPGDSVLLISSEVNESVLAMKEAINNIVSWNGHGGVVSGSIYNENQKLEIIFNIDQEDESRPILKTAQKYLEREEKDSYFDARYVIYADSGQIAFVFDDNAYTNLQATEFVVDIFMEKCVNGRQYIALPKGVVASGTIDLKAIQEELDIVYTANQWEEFEAAAKAKYGSYAGGRIIDAFRTYYSMIDDRVVSWWAYMYDPGIGGFYGTSSGRDHLGYLPNIEGTDQILGHLSSSGMLDTLGGNVTENLPRLMVHQLVYYFKSLQNPTNGYFYNPQLGVSGTSTYRLGRDQGRCTSRLVALGSRPTYTHPNGTAGDGITADEYWDLMVAWGEISPDEPRPYVPTSLLDYEEYLNGGKVTESLGGSKDVAVSKIILTASDDASEFVANFENFDEWLKKYGDSIDKSPYSGVSNINATYKTIEAAAKKIGKSDDASKWYYGMDFCEMVIKVLNDHITDKGLFGTYDKASTDPSAGCKYANTNGLMKGIPIYTAWGYAYPKPLEAVEGCLIGIMSDEKSTGNICETYNIWEALSGVINNVQKFGTEEQKRELLGYTDEAGVYHIGTVEKALGEYGPEAVINTYNKQKNYQTSEGGFSHNVAKGGTENGGLPIGLGLKENNVDANGFGMQSVINAMANCFGLRSYRPALFTESDWMTFIEIVLELQPVIKYSYDEVNGTSAIDKVFTFDEVLPQTGLTVTNNASFPTNTHAWSSAVGKDGESGVLRINKAATGSGSSMNMVSLANVKATGATLTTFEVDIKYSNITSKSESQIQLGTASKTSMRDMPIFILLTFDGTANGSKIKYSDYTNGTTNGQYIDTGAVVGEWFTLKVEYYSGDANTFRFRTYINDTLIYTSNAIYSQKIYAGADTLPSAADIQRASWSFNEKFAGTFEFDNISLIQSRGTLEGDVGVGEPGKEEMPDDVPDGPPESIPDTIPEGITTPAASDAVKFDTIPDSKVTTIVSSDFLNVYYVVEDISGNKVLYIDKRSHLDSNSGVIFRQYPTKTEENATIAIFEADFFLSGYEQTEVIQFTAHTGNSTTPYMMVLKAKAKDRGSIVQFNNYHWDTEKNAAVAQKWIDTPAKVGEWFRVRIEYEVTAINSSSVVTGIAYRMYVNNTLIKEDTAVYGKDIHSGKSGIPTVEALSQFNFSFNASTKGRFAVDNFSFRKLAKNDRVEGELVIPDPTIGSGFQAPTGAITFSESFDDMVAAGKIKVDIKESASNTYSVVSERGDKMLSLVKTDNTKQEVFHHNVTEAAGSYDYVTYEAVLKYAPAEGETNGDLEVAFLDASGEKVLYTYINYKGADGALQIQAYKRVASGTTNSGFKSPSVPVKAGEFFKIRIEYILGKDADCTKIYINDELLISGDYYSGTKAEGEGYTDTPHTAIGSAVILNYTKFVGTTFIDYSWLTASSIPESTISFDKDWADKIEPITNAAFAELNTWKVETVEGNNVLTVSKQGVDNSGTSWNGGISFVVKPTEKENGAKIAILEFDMYFSELSGAGNNQITMGHQGVRTNQASPMLYSIPAASWKTGVKQHVVFFYEVLEADSSNIPTKIRYGYSIDGAAFTIFDEPYAKATSLAVNGGSYQLPRIDQVDSFTFALNNSFKGNGWFDNFRMALLQSYELPEPPAHEHNFVDGKCSCGETDPNYKPEDPGTPETPDTSNIFDFEDGTIPSGIVMAINPSFAEQNTWQVVDVDGNKMLYVNKPVKDTVASNSGVSIKVNATKKEADAKIAVFKFDVLFTEISGMANQVNINHQGNSGNKWSPFIESVPNLTVNVEYSIVVTYEVTATDGAGIPTAAKLTIYVNGEAVKTITDIHTAATNLVPNGGTVNLPTASQIDSFTFALNNNFIGKAYFDNMSVELLGEFSIGEEHEHNFVDGKCECGESDPNYKPEAPDTPDEPETSNGFDFEDGEVPSNLVINIDPNFKELNTYTVVDAHGSKMLFVDKAGKDTSGTSWNGGVSFRVSPTKIEEGATVAVLSLDLFMENVTAYDSQITMAHQGQNSKPIYPFLLQFPKTYDQMLHIVITYEVTEFDGSGVPTAMKYTMTVNGEITIESGDLYKDATNLQNGSVKLPKVDQVNFFTFAFNNSFLGDVYLDNIKLELLKEYHEHKFVDGECQCGEKDPSYVAPDYNATETFESISPKFSYIASSTNPLIVADPAGTDNKVLELDTAFSTNTKSIEYTVTEIKSGAEVLVFETDLFIESDATVKFEIFLVKRGYHSNRAQNVVFAYFSNSDVNIFENGDGTGGKPSGIVKGQWNKIRMEFRLNNDGGTVTPSLIVYVNGNEVATSAGLYGTGYYGADGKLDSSLFPALSDMDGVKFNISSSVASGKYYLDNFLLHHLKEEDIEAPENPGEPDAPEVNDGTINFENAEIPKELTVSTYSEFIGEGLNSWAVVDAHGSKMLFVDKNVKDTESGKYLGGVSFKYGPTKVEKDAKVAIISFDIYMENVTGYDSQITLQHQGKTGKTITPFLLKIPQTYDKMLNLSIIYEVTATNDAGVPTAMKYTYLVNGEIVDESATIYESASELLNGSVNLPLASQVDSVTIALNNSFLGDAYFDNFKLELLAELPHTHRFVEGKCECGEVDPSYVAPHTHEYVSGICTVCGEADPSVIAFNEMPATSVFTISSPGTTTEGVVGENKWEIVTATGTDNKVLHISKGSNGRDESGKEINTSCGVNNTIFVTYADENANVAVFETKLLFKNITGNSGMQIRFYGKSTSSSNAPNMLWFTTGAGTADGAKFTYADYANGAQNKDENFGKLSGAVIGTWFTLRIEYRVTATDEAGKPTAIETRTYVDGNLVAKSAAVYGTNLVSGTTDIPKVSEISRVGFNFNNAYLGDFYIDDLSLKLINEPPHEHSFVEGKCECGETDPNYVAPEVPAECEHSYAEGVCTKCGAADPDYKPHEHSFVDGKCECGESDPNWVEPAPEPKEEVALTFDEMPANVTFSNCTAEIAADPANGENKALVVAGDGVTKAICFNISADKDDYDVAIAEYKMLWTGVNNIVAEFMLVSGANDKTNWVAHNYFSNGRLYIYPNNTEALLGDSGIGKEAWFTVRIEYRVIEVDGVKMPEVTYKINDAIIGVDNGLAGTGYYADGVLDSSRIPTPSEITQLRVQISSSVKSGSVYIDDVVFMHNYDSEEPDAPAECEHSYAEGVCTKCGAADPNYVPETPDVPEHTHTYVEGKCECGEADPNYKPYTVTFDEMPAASVLNVASPGITAEGINGTNTWEIVTEDGNKVLHIVKGANGSSADGTAINTNCGVSFTQYVTKRDENANVMIFEADVKYVSIAFVDYIQIGANGNSNTPFLGLLKPAGVAEGSAIKNASTGTEGSETSAKVGEWFHIRIEYRVTATDESGTPTAIETKYFFGEDEAIVTTAVQKKMLKVSDITYVGFAFNNKNLGEYCVDNLSLRLEYEAPAVME